MYFSTGCCMVSSWTELEVLFGWSGLTFSRNVPTWKAAWWNYDFFFSFPFSYQVSFIVFKHLRLQHQKSDMCILLVLSPSWYLTKICATHVFVVLGDDIEQGNLIIFVFVSPTTYVITHRTNENTNCLYPPFICHMAVTLIFVSTP